MCAYYAESTALLLSQLEESMALTCKSQPISNSLTMANLQTMHLAQSSLILTVQHLQHTYSTFLLCGLTFHQVTFDKLNK